MIATLEENVARTLASARTRRTELLKDLASVQEELARTESLILALSGRKPDPIRMEEFKEEKSSSYSVDDSACKGDERRSVTKPRAKSNKRKGQKLLRAHVEAVLREEPVSSMAEMLKRLESINPTSNGSLGRLLQKGSGKWVEKHGDQGWILLKDSASSGN